MSTADPRPLVAHVMYRFDVGGLENGVVNLINHMPADAYRHAVIALTAITDFKKRIRRDDVRFIALDKPPGHLIGLYPRLFRLFRELQPAIVHSRNLTALEVQPVAWAAGVRARVQSEHGRDIGDLDGSNVRHKWMRRAYDPFVSRYIALSKDLEDWLVRGIGLPARKIEQIYNGVDSGRFHPAAEPTVVPGCPFRRPEHWLVGTVGRMQPVKDQTLLARAFIRALEMQPALRSRLRLVMVGDGPLRPQVAEILAAGGAADLAWLAGERDDVPELLRSLDCFVLPSLAEGISNTILEAMASGLPVIATRVGGNVELVQEAHTGLLVPAADAEAMARALVGYAMDGDSARQAGRAGRAEVERRFSLEAMVGAYRGLYDRLLFGPTRPSNQHH